MILYVGNKLAKKGYTPSSVDVVAPLLAERYEVVAVSDKRSQLLRLVEIVLTILKNRKKVKLILVDTYSTLGFYFVLTISFLSRIFHLRYVPILHGGNLESRLKHNPKLSGYIFKSRQVASLVAPSHFLKTVFEKYGYRDVEYIPNAIPIADYHFLKREVFRPSLLWVRSFNALYNPAMAIKALHRISAQFPEATLCMVGPDKDGSLQATKDLAAELGVVDRVEFTGKLSKAEWHAKSTECDLFINTSSIDNTPVSVIEAMALGLPVISTNVGGIPFLLTDRKDAMLVPAGDDPAMADNILRLLTNPNEAKEIATCGREKAATFDWERVKHLWYKLIDDAIQ